MRTHEPERAHTFTGGVKRSPTGVRPPTGAHQWGVPAVAVLSTFASETTHTAIKVKRVGILFLRVRPLCKTFLPPQDDPGRGQSFVELPSGAARRRNQRRGGDAGSKPSRCKELIFYVYICSTHPVWTPTACHYWLHLFSNHKGLCQIRLMNPAAH